MNSCDRNKNELVNNFLKIILERMNLPHQIMYRWKGNLTKNKIRSKYQENILIW